VSIVRAAYESKWMWVLAGTVVCAGLAGGLSYRQHHVPLTEVSPANGAFCDDGIGAAKAHVRDERASIAAVASAQQTRAVRGTVRDEDGKVVEGVTVQIQNMASLNVRSYITQKDGDYHFEELDPNVSYQLQATYKGIFGPVRTLSRFDSSMLATIDLTIHLDR
jgi:hypothetical protein